MTAHVDESEVPTIRRRMPPGTTPGTISVDPQAPKPTISVMAFGPAGMIEKCLAEPHEVAELIQEWPVIWINVDGLGDKDVIQQFGTMFELHRLALEDVVNVHQRPKVEDYEEYLFFVARMVYQDTSIETEQLSMFIGEQFVLTFQERPGGDCFSPVRERIRKGAGRIRMNGAGFLAYSLIDALVDAYFPIIEWFGDELETLEDEVLDRPVRSTVTKIHHARRDLLILRRAIWPLREAINAILRDQCATFNPETRVYFRDCYDHTIQILDLVEAYRELVSDLMDVYLSSISAKLNEVMRVLTVASTIFMPMTFVASIYGMNFTHMPEIGWKYGYVMVLGVMAAIFVGQLIFFRRKGWLGGALADDREESKPD
ncbi:MAG TPA: magnesium/cobalt transporter CorA [Candidatus Hydrogenedentes bacterium]|nr:magnesium/cobalt transporter CorA [Candidatus Hydrogenedentota bacterium]